jgi:hypothetical protein
VERPAVTPVNDVDKIDSDEEVNSGDDEAVECLIGAVAMNLSDPATAVGVSVPSTV